MNHQPHFATIIARYHLLLERYTRRFMANPHLASAVVKEVFESLYEQGRLVEGPQLRHELRRATRHCWQGIDTAIARANATLAAAHKVHNHSINNSSQQ